MGNFENEYKKGQKGGNKGLPLGIGLEKLSRYINGIQRGMMYGIAAAPKVGKSTFTDYCFVISPYLYCLRNNIDFKIIYFSFEMDRVSKEFDFASYFLYYDYGYTHINLPKGVSIKGKNFVPLDSSLLRGRIQDDNENTVKIPKELEKDLIKVYKNRIIPLFGEYDSNGKRLKKGLIEFIEQKENPTGLRNKLLNFARERGSFIYETFIGKDGLEGKKLVSYKPNNPEEYIGVITDTIRKIPTERGFKIKETIDKYLEYCTEIRNICGYFFVQIVHLNRSMADVNRLKYLGDKLFPTPEDVKDTGNLSEECNHLITLFNPNDERYNLTSHFGSEIRDKQGNELYPNMRTIHLVESRHVSFPAHFRVEMEGNTKNFKELIIKH